VELLELRVHLEARDFLVHPELEPQEPQALQDLLVPLGLLVSLGPVVNLELMAMTAFQEHLGNLAHQVIRVRVDRQVSAELLAILARAVSPELVESQDLLGLVVPLVKQA
jgi:hypothetical protein